eukprot:3130198-Alexandrium_andersonii.AAC.1
MAAAQSQLQSAPVLADQTATCFTAGAYTCWTCAREFVSAAALKGHCARKHGFRARYRSYVYDTHCV